MARARVLSFVWGDGFCREQFEAASPAELLDRGLEALTEMLRHRPHRRHFLLSVVPRPELWTASEYCIAVGVPSAMAQAGEWLDENAQRLWKRAGEMGKWSERDDPWDLPF